ncbi:hypothetical protein RyT2_24140 [Pseudolactococcus yaeyamensis]
MLLLTLLGMLPFIFGYILKLEWHAPFIVVIPFLFLPLIGLFHTLIISKSFLFRYRVPEKVLNLIIVSVYTIIITLLILLSHYIPLKLLVVYIFLLSYSLLSMLTEVTSAIRKNRISSDSLESFLIAEEERENISIHIHDTIIQDVVFFIRELKEKESVFSGNLDTIDILEETVYLLRELCSDVYPLMIQELRLKNALYNMVNRLQKKFPVKVSIDIEVVEFDFSEKISNFVLRSIRELMNNSIFHGKAEKIYLSISEDDIFYYFIVRDDGIFPLNVKQKKTESHFGLDVIKEKLKLLNGRISMDINDETIVTLVIPKEKELSK